MSKSLSDHVVDVLSATKSPMSALEISHRVGLKTRKDVNPTLYNLQKKGQIRKVSDTPVMWLLTQSSVLGRSEQMVPATQATLPADGVEGKILAFLSGKGEACTSLEIAKAIGYSTRKEVNPYLYAMAKDNLIVRDDSKGAPQWTLLCSKQQQRNTLPLSVPPAHTSLPVQRAPLSLSGSVGLLGSTGGNGTPMETETPSLEGQILAILGMKPGGGLTALEIAKGIGMNTTRSQVNSQLETLKGQGKVTCLGTTPEQWVLVSQKLPSSGSSASYISDLTRNPVSSLNEYCQSKQLPLTFPLIEERGPPHRKIFVVAAMFGNNQFRAESSSLKEAKRMAADLALQSIRASTSVAPIPPAPLGPGQVAMSQSSFCDRIHSMSQSRFLQLQQSIRTAQPGRKVIAAFVMEDTTTSDMEVVAMGSGTQCIAGDKTSPKGLAVNDSHAEVVARRSLMRFLYKELLAKLTNTRTIFVNSETAGLAKVRETLKFHLYISTAPCGDGSLFSRDDHQNRLPPSDDSHMPTIENRKQGILRTKIEDGEGTIPVGDNAEQTWDGILHGERMRTMSCSDKVLRWNVLGLQGALLSQFMEPLYMSSLTLGSLHHHGHLSRAVCCRANGVESSLPFSFTLRHPSLGRAQGGDEMKRHTEKTTSFSLNWAFGDEKAELSDGVNGRLQTDSGAPRISKASLFSTFANLHTKVNGSVPKATYSDVKKASLAYQQAKMAFFELFRKKGYGMWVKKPEELENFTIE